MKDSFQFKVGECVKIRNRAFSVRFVTVLDVATHDKPYYEVTPALFSGTHKCTLFREEELDKITECDIKMELTRS